MSFFKDFALPQARRKRSFARPHRFWRLVLISYICAMKDGCLPETDRRILYKTDEFSVFYNKMPLSVQLNNLTQRLSEEIEQRLCKTD